MSLPPNLRKQGARDTASREGAVLDNFEVVREIEQSCLSNPSSMDLIAAARNMGLGVKPLMNDEETKQHLYGIFDIRNGTLGESETLVAILHSYKGENNLYPTENRW